MLGIQWPGLGMGQARAPQEALPIPRPTYGGLASLVRSGECGGVLMRERQAPVSWTGLTTVIRGLGGAGHCESEREQVHWSLSALPDAWS